MTGRLQKPSGGEFDWFSSMLTFKMFWHHRSTALKHPYSYFQACGTKIRKRGCPKIGKVATCNVNVTWSVSSLSLYGDKSGYHADGNYKSITPEEREEIEGILFEKNDDFRKSILNFVRLHRCWNFAFNFSEIRSFKRKNPLRFLYEIWVQMLFRIQCVIDSVIVAW